MKNAEYWIKKLGLEKHPEGGWFKEVYRSEETTAAEHLPERFKGERHHSTSIYFMLTSFTFSAFHRIKSDELWHFYDGSAVTIHIIDEGGKHSHVILGREIDKGEVLQYAIPHGVWFGAEVIDEDSFSLVGCTVAPGFHFDDFELARRNELAGKHPEHIKIIERLTREIV
jgi:predicted cupin superfamily sugar epimerase